uniref:Uncharacterized protein n=1 Tax=Schizopora paradoxa TaxID=27342 RepID=A0A5B9RB61_9AGAM|nr:hypothetical protein Schpa_000053 [Schizopora paradoxa]QEG57216.1 hypothetical protein Schpa_000053 [Schizopora paradoxa]
MCGCLAQRIILTAERGVIPCYAFNFWHFLKDAALCKEYYYYTQLVNNENWLYIYNNIRLVLLILFISLKLSILFIEKILQFTHLNLREVYNGFNLYFIIITIYFYYF